jgi:hypothetical protein
LICGILLIAVSKIPVLKTHTSQDVVQTSVKISFKPWIGILISVIVVGIFALSSKAQTQWSMAWLWLAGLFGAATIMIYFDKCNNCAFLSIKEWILGLFCTALLLALPALGDVPGGQAFIFVLGLLTFIAGPKWIPLDAGLVRLLGLILFFFCFYSYDFLHWRFSIIGDELSHFYTAEGVYSGKAQGTILEGIGAYGHHPLSAAYIQAGTMRLYGMDAYGWRMSEVLAILLASFPLYYLARDVSGSSPALIAIITFLSSTHLLGFTRIGYNQCQGLPSLLLPMACGLLALRRQSLFGYFLTGVLLASGFYTFGMTILLMPLTPLLLLCRTNFSKANVFKWLALSGTILSVGLFCASSPRIVDQEWFYSMKDGMTSNQKLNFWITLYDFKTWGKTIHALFSFFSYGFNSHYMSGPLLSPLSAIFAAIGIGSILGSRNRIAFWLLTLWATTAFVAGGLSPYAFPPNTRIFYMMPIFALFTGIGFHSLFSCVSVSFRNASVVIFSIITFFFSYYQFYIITPTLVRSNYFSYILKSAQETPQIRKIFLVAHHPHEMEVANQFLSFLRLKNSHTVYISSESIQNGLDQVKGEKERPVEIHVVANLPNVNEWTQAIDKEWTHASKERVVDPAGISHSIIYKIQNLPSHSSLN